MPSGKYRAGKILNFSSVINIWLRLLLVKVNSSIVWNNIKILHQIKHALYLWIIWKNTIAWKDQALSSLFYINSKQKCSWYLITARLSSFRIFTFYQMDLTSTFFWPILCSMWSFFLFGQIRKLENFFATNTY